MKTQIPFTKMVGTGNDFVVVDTRLHRMGALKNKWPQVARVMCDRRSGVGADGLLVLEPSEIAHVKMRIFNPDGSEPSMCGNGIRCLAWYAHRIGAAKVRFTIETKAGIKRAWIISKSRVRIDMGVPQLLRSVTWSRPIQGNMETDVIDSGVPHLVVWVDGMNGVDVETLGRRLRRHRRFRPQGVNVDFVRELGARVVRDASSRSAIHRVRLEMRTYERGVEGETQACGTGAVAAAAEAMLIHKWLLLAKRRRESDAERYEVDVRVPGGALRVALSGKVRVHPDKVVFGHAFLEGPVKLLGRGTFTWDERART